MLDQKRITKYLGMLAPWEKYKKLLFLGLDNSGKTTLLHMLKCDSTVQQHFDLLVFLVNAVVFLTDGHDVQRLPDGKAALNAILAEKELERCPIFILGNKMDRPGAIPEHILRSYLELHNATGKEYAPRPRSELSSRTLELFMCSVLNRQGYDKGFRWLAEYLR